MNKLYPLLLLLGLISINGNAQALDKLIKDIANTSCDCLNTLDSSSATKNEISACIGQSYSTHQLRLSEEMINYMDKNNASENEAGIYFQGKIVGSLFSNCPIFHAFSIKESEKKSDLITSKPSTELVKKTADEICNCLDKVDSLTQLEIDICLDASTNISNKELQEEYKTNPKITKNLTAYLMSSCTKYSKFAISKQLKEK